MFKPMVAGKDSPSIQKVAHESLKLAGISNIGTLASNITVAGGNTCLPGFNERLQKEVQSLVAQSVNVKVWGGDDQI